MTNIGSMNRRMSASGIVLTSETMNPDRLNHADGRHDKLRTVADVEAKIAAIDAERASLVERLAALKEPPVALDGQSVGVAIPAPDGSSRSTSTRRGGWR